jgi:23S rRNA (guanosine2251-2'-O)-methyltransferase
LIAVEEEGREASVSDVLEVARSRGEEPLVVLLDQIQDPQNLGALIRSTYALGGHGVVIPRDRAAQITPAVVRASAGAALHLLVARVTNLKHALSELKDAGVWSAAAVLDGEPAEKARLDGPLALVIGSEGKGVRPTVAEHCDLKVTIPLARFDSLNASVAGGILLYEALRQRRRLT